MKNEKRTSSLNFNVRVFWKTKNQLVLCLCLNFSIETKIKTLFLISYFNLSKKMNWHFGYTELPALALNRGITSILIKDQLLDFPMMSKRALLKCCKKLWFCYKRRNKKYKCIKIWCWYCASNLHQKSERYYKRDFATGVFSCEFCVFSQPACNLKTLKTKYQHDVFM